MAEFVSACAAACAAAADASKAFQLYEEMKAANVETERQVRNLQCAHFVDQQEIQAYATAASKAAELLLYSIEFNVLLHSRLG